MRAAAAIAVLGVLVAGDAASAKPKKRKPARAPAKLPAPKPPPTVPYAMPTLSASGRFTLANGLEVRWTRVAAPRVTALVAFPAGWRFAPAGAPGIPGLVAALLELGSPRVRPGDHARYVARLGGRVEHALDGDTLTIGATVVPAALPALGPLLAELASGPVARADALAPALDALTPEPRDAPTVAAELARDLVLARGPAGELGNDPLTAAVDHARAHLVARGAVIAVAGDVDEAAVRGFAAAFETLPAGEPPTPAARGSLPATSARRRTLTPTGTGALAMAWRIPGGHDGAAASVAVLAEVLGRGGSRGSAGRAGDPLNDGGRLAEALTRRTPVAADVRVVTTTEADVGALVVLATPRPGTTLPALERAVRDEVLRLTRDPPPHYEVARAARSWAVGAGRALSTPEDAAAWLAALATTRGDVDPAAVLAAAGAVTQGDLLAAGRRIFLDGDAVVVVVPAGAP